MSEESGLAHVIWKEEYPRYELWITGILKAYSEPSEALKDSDVPDKEKHEKGRVLLVKMAREKKYTVIGA